MSDDWIAQAVASSDQHAIADHLEVLEVDPRICDWVRSRNRAGRPRSINTINGARFLIFYWERCAAINADAEQRVRICFEIAEELGVDEDRALALIDGKRWSVIEFARKLVKDREELGTPYPWESLDK